MQIIGGSRIVCLGGQTSALSLGLLQSFLLAADLLHRFLLLRLEQIGVELLVLLVALVSERTGSSSLRCLISVCMYSDKVYVCHSSHL